MKRLARALSVASLLVFTASPLAAQGITGRWIAEFDRSVRNENGSVSTGDRAKVRLVLAQRGDSVIGTQEPVTATGAPETGRPRRQLRGTISGNKVSLSTQAEVRRNVNGEESVHKVTVVYDLTLSADKLEGTMIAKGAEIDAMPARPFSARREKP